MKRLAALSTATALAAASVLTMAVPASADPFPVDGSITIGGTYWSFNTDWAGLGHVYDEADDLDSSSHSYGQLLIDTDDNTFGAWCDTETAVLATDAATGDVVISCEAQESTVPDIFVSVEYRFYATGDLARLFYTVENRGTEEFTPGEDNFYLEDDFDETELLHSSSGDTTGALTDADTWIVNTGEDSVVSTSAWAVTGNTSTDSSDSDVLEDEEAYHDFNGITFPAGSTTYFASYQAVIMPAEPFDADATAAAFDAAIAAASQFDTFDGRLIAGLPADITVVNWGDTTPPAPAPAPAPEPQLAATGTDGSSLMLGGAGALLLLLAGIGVVTIRSRRTA